MKQSHQKNNANYLTQSNELSPILNSSVDISNDLNEYQPRCNNVLSISLYNLSAIFF